jgi:hypothetical protein
MQVYLPELTLHLYLYKPAYFQQTNYMTQKISHSFEDK